MDTLRHALIGHWPLLHDTADHGPLALPSAATALTLGQAGPGAKVPGAARFNGRDSVLTVADQPALAVGTGDFAVAAWLHSAATCDVVGQIADKFDPATRRGWQVAIHSATGMVSTAQAHRRHLHFGMDADWREATWRDEGRPGQSVKICALTSSQGQLYAGTFELGAQEAGRVWRRRGPHDWEDLGNPLRSNAIFSLCEFQGALYAGTGRYKAMGSALGETQNQRPGGRVYRLGPGGDWQDCGQPGGRDAVPEETPTSGYNTGKADVASGLTVFRDQLYAFCSYRTGVYRYAGGDQWEPVGLAHLRLMSLHVWRGQLLALINGGEVYQLEGDGTWISLGRPGTSTQTYGALTYNGQLYAGNWPNGEVCRYLGDKTWENRGKLGYEMEIMGGILHNGLPYWGSLPSAHIWRQDPTGFTVVGSRDSTPSPLRRAWCLATWQGRLHAGTLPGGRVWSLETGRMATWDQTFPGDWHHLVLQRQQGWLQVLVDGQVVATANRASAGEFNLDNRVPLRWGAGAYEHLDGCLADLRLYRRALSPAEILALATPG